VYSSRENFRNIKLFKSCKKPHVSYLKLSLLTCVQRLQCLLVYFHFSCFPPNRCVDTVTGPSKVGDHGRLQGYIERLHYYSHAILLFTGSGNTGGRGALGCGI
jgi:hypothetical protein